MKLAASFLALGLLVGCSDGQSVSHIDDPGSDAPDTTSGPGAPTTEGGDRGAGTGTAPGAPGAAPRDAGEPARDAGTPAPDGGAPARDAGTPAPDAGVPAPAGPFVGAPAYVATLGGSTLKRDHGANGDPAGLACLTCHAAGKGAPAFFFGGTVYEDATRAKVVARAEVRVRSAAGAAQSVYTDANGNFYLRQRNGAQLAAGTLTGARDATTVRSMAGAVPNGDCNSCHRPGQAGPIVLR